MLQLFQVILSVLCTVRGFSHYVQKKKYIYKVRALYRDRRVQFYRQTFMNYSSRKLERERYIHKVVVQ